MWKLEFQWIENLELSGPEKQIQRLRQWGKDTRVIKHRNKTAPNPNKTIYIHSNRKPRSTTVINMFPQPMRGVTVVLMCDHSKNNMHYMHAIPNYSQFICNDNDSNNEFHLERWVFFGCAFIFSKIKNA